MATAAALGAAGPAHADYVDSVLAQLRAQGYRQISVSNTLLGRSRVFAKGKGGTREIIMNPRTGEILRDLWTSADGSSGPAIVGSQDDKRDDDDKGSDDRDSDDRDSDDRDSDDRDSDNDSDDDDDSGDDSDDDNDDGDSGSDD